jgi:ABC-2 type transport system permease protein
MLRLYWRLVWARERSNMQYRLSFWLLTIASAIFLLQDLIAIVVFFEHVPQFGGWSLAEVAFLYGFSAFAFRTAELLATGFDDLPRHLRMGTFDRVLVRPLGAFFQTLAGGLALRRFGGISQSLLITVSATTMLGIPWTLDKVAVLAVAAASGIAIYFAIFVAGAAYCFWTIQGTELINTFTNGAQFSSSYPLDAYDDWLRRVLTFVLPVAFVNYYPALYLLDRPPPLGLPDWVRLLSPLVALLFAAAAWRLWSVGVRRYLSTGS